jgi:Fe(3+) dicitrate transport protein
MALATTIPVVSMAQDVTDSTKKITDITIVGRSSKKDIFQLPEVVGTTIYAGKKNALVVLQNVQGNVTTNNMRQVLAKVPGIQIWESDPSGTQIGIAARGLSPNRSWEFNIRQNGYDIAADPFGYPEAYYNPQLQGVQRIEIIRGQGALQYGPQFGGMVNYILRNGSDINKTLQFETEQTFGSNGLFNSYNAIGGKKNKWNYYGFFDHRQGNGYRKNSKYFTNAGYATATLHATKTLDITAEVMHTHIRSQQAGGLTDAQLQQDRKESFRSRNWFDIKWTTPALIINYNINAHTIWNTKLNATLGDRNSVGYLQSILLTDSINPATGTYNTRTPQVDYYRNYALESRIITNYYIGSIQNTISGGIKLYSGTTQRKADGKGTTGSNYDMTLTEPYKRDISFNSKNAAVFVENIVRLNKKFIIIPGLRYEWLEGAANGRNSVDANNNPIYLQDITRSRNFLLLGLAAEYHTTASTEFYANYAQAYRPIQFANLQAAPTTDVVDPNLTDSKGYNIDFGYRGTVKNYLQFDISTYYLQYGNRTGAITPTGASYRLITNVGTSHSKGVETFVEFNPIKALQRKTDWELSIFTSYSYTHAKYSNNHKDANTKGKYLENTPQNIMRGGISVGYKKLLFTTQVSYTDKAYADANNTVTASTNGQNGVIPSYTITDLTVSYPFKKILTIKAGINNLTDEVYFTRRAGGYPGPGALPADGRTAFVTLSARF